MYSKAHKANVVVSQAYGVPSSIYSLGYHAGIDLCNYHGAPIYAVAGGYATIEWESSGSDYGNNVMIDHGNGLKTHYSHLDTISIGSGNVTEGQKIGTEGKTGLTTGTHLDFELYENGSRVDPTYVVQYGLESGGDFFMGRVIGNRKVIQNSWLREQPGYEDSKVIGYNGTPANGQPYPNTPFVSAGEWVMVLFTDGDFAYIANVRDNQKGIFGWQGYIEKNHIAGL